MFKSVFQAFVLVFVCYMNIQAEKQTTQMLYFQESEVKINDKSLRQLALKIEPFIKGDQFCCASIIYDYVQPGHLIIHCSFIAMLNLAEGMMRLLLLRLLKMHEHVEQISFLFSSDEEFTPQERILQNILQNFGFKQKGSTFETEKLTKCLLCQVLYGEEFWEREDIEEQEEPDVIKNSV